MQDLEWSNPLAPSETTSNIGMYVTLSYILLNHASLDLHRPLSNEHFLTVFSSVNDILAILQQVYHIFNILQDKNVLF